MTIYNFSAGPSTLPQPVLEKARSELLDWQGTGVSVMEVSHRGKDFIAYAEKTEATLRRLMNIPSNYHILFLQGGATSQFSMVPLNLLHRQDRADYVNTGLWSKKAIKEASRFGDIKIVADSEPDNFTHIPPQSQWQLRDAAYLHYTPNETINGVEFHWTPELGDAPLVADMSSVILSREIDVTKFGLIYAGAQKNIGPAGVTIVIIRDDLAEHAKATTPEMFIYKNHVESQSCYNTPPVFCWYMAGLMFDWLEQQGGVSAIEKQNIKKSQMLYDYIDQSDFYHSPVAKDFRSRMNVPFTLADGKLEKAFLSQAEEQGLIALKGHRLVGGMRASIYNTMPIEGVEALIQFMKSFEEAS